MGKDANAPAVKAVKADKKVKAATAPVAASASACGTSKTSNPSKPSKVTIPVQKTSMKPGQKYTALKTDPLSLFYTSTYRQKKGKSPMAEKWILEHGLFTTDKATRIDLRNQMQKLALKEEKKKKK